MQRGCGAPINIAQIIFVRYYLTLPIIIDTAYTLPTILQSLRPDPSGSQIQYRQLNIPAFNATYY